MARMSDRKSDSVRFAARVLKVAVMGTALFWILAYRLQTNTSEIPDFVYVNF